MNGSDNFPTTSLTGPLNKSGPPTKELDIFVVFVVAIITLGLPARICLSLDGLAILLSTRFLRYLG